MKVENRQEVCVEGKKLELLSRMRMRKRKP